MIHEDVEGQLQLGSLETAEYPIEKRDARSGSGANFIAAWISDKPVYELTIEAVMVGRPKEPEHFL
ncbi:MAG: DUF3124 domain-containing protein [Gammaproteobacteria bacterium]|nr:DUF3124 domain-containing protein [Gammaproteobacteria bacterium]